MTGGRYSGHFFFFPGFAITLLIHMGAPLRQAQDPLG